MTRRQQRRPPAKLLGGAEEFPGGMKIFGLRQLHTAIHSTFFDKGECSDKHVKRAGGQKEKVHMVTRPSIAWHLTQ